MLYRITLLIVLGVILLASKVGQQNSRIESIILTQIDEGINRLQAFEKQPDIKNHALLRQNILSLNWVVKSLGLEESVSTINNHKFKIDQTDCYKEFGLLQHWEKRLLLGNSIRPTDFKVLYTFFISLKEYVLVHDWRKEQVLTGLLLDHYNLYLQTLTGSYHLQTKEVLRDYQKILDSHLSVLEGVDERKQFEDQYKFLKKYVRKQKFEELDRIVILKEYIEPIHEQYIHLINSDYPKSFSPVNLDQKLFDDNWLRSEDFVDLDKNLDQKKLSDLGRLLFFDPLLSGNNKRSCASCHQAQKAFSDGRSTSLGFDYLSKLDKNSPSLINSVFNYSFGHDLSKKNLAAQIDFVIHQEQEFRTTYTEIIEKLSESEEYIQLFKDCFPNQEKLDSTQINQALEAYIMTLVRFDSPFDLFMRGEQSLNPEVLDGYNLFMGKAECGTCHYAPLFSGVHSINSRREQSYICNENLRIKTPTVRNLKFTMPYFHQGTLNSQEELFEKVLNNVKQNTHPNKLLTSQEQDKIIAFMDALNDESAVKFDAPDRLPKLKNMLNKIERRPGGIY